MREFRYNPRWALCWLSAGLAALAALIFLLPSVENPVSSDTAQIIAFALFIAPVGAIIYGFLGFTGSLSTPWLLISGSATAVLGGLVIYFFHSDITGAYLLLMLFLADALRIIAAASFGFALAHYVSSPGTALLVACVAALADIFSVLAGPTHALIRGNSPALQFLLLVFPSFGHPFGFALGASDFIFLALFSALGLLLNLRYPLTLLSCCIAAFLALAAGFLLERPLPALPFISLAFIVANADLILSRKRS